MDEKPWFGSYEPGVPRELVFPEKALPETLRETANRFPRRPAIRFFGRDISYQELDRRVDRFANLLISRGVGPGDRVALYLPNVPPAVIGYYGILRAGAVVTQINPLQTPRETIHQLKDSGAKFVVALDSFVPILRPIAEECGLKAVWVVRVSDDLPLIKSWVVRWRNRKDKGRVSWPTEAYFRSFPRDLAAASDARVRIPLKMDDLALLQYTGGTTGLPKGVMLTHRNIVANAWQARVWIAGSGEGRHTVLGAIPFFHCYGMTVGMNLSVLVGASMVLVPSCMLPTCFISGPAGSPGPRRPRRP